MEEGKLERKARLNLRLPADMVEFMKSYARERGTTVSELIREYFRSLMNVRPRQF